MATNKKYPVKSLKSNALSEQNRNFGTIIIRYRLVLDGHNNSLKGSAQPTHTGLNKGKDR